MHRSRPRRSYRDLANSKRSSTRTSGRRLSAVIRRSVLLPGRPGQEHKLERDTRQLPDALHECASLDTAQQTAQPETAGEDAQGNPECDASNPLTASKSPLASLERAAKVFMNRVARCAPASWSARS